MALAVLRSAGVRRQAARLCRAAAPAALSQRVGAFRIPTRTGLSLTRSLVRHNSAATVLAGVEEPPGGLGSRASVPVILLAGFLGAGKTTLLEHLLGGNHGLRLGVLVNDLASVNVDARVLEGAVRKAGVRSIELSNGCVCCTASDDMLRSILELLRPEPGSDREARPALDAVVVELSGAAEPRQAAAALEPLEESGAHLARTVTVVDSPSFAADWVAEIPASRAGERPADAEGGAERLSTLLAEQLEGADLVLLNKADAASAAELARARAVARALNEAAELLVVEYGRVAPEVVLPQSLFEPSARRAGSDHRAAIGEEGVQAHAGDLHHQEHGHGHARSHDHGHEGHAHCTDPTHDHRSSAERRFGIRSFVYTAQRPFSRNRFVMELQRWQTTWQQMGKTLELKEEAASLPRVTSEDEATEGTGGCPLAPVIRSKGLLWMDSQPRDALYWSHAGRCASISHWGFWPQPPSGADGGPGSGAAEAARAAYSEWAAGAFGQARSELVFIGPGIDEAAVRAKLDSCLISEEEFWAIQTSSRPMAEK